MDTQRDLSLAYTPGVAVPVLDIEKDPEKAYEYTSKGNLVAVLTNGRPSWAWVTEEHWPASRSWKAKEFSLRDLRMWMSSISK